METPWQSEVGGERGSPLPAAARGHGAQRTQEAAQRQGGPCPSEVCTGRHASTHPKSQGGSSPAQLQTSVLRSGSSTGLVVKDQPLQPSANESCDDVWCLSLAGTAWGKRACQLPVSSFQPGSAAGLTGAPLGVGSEAQATAAGPCKHGFGHRRCQGSRVTPAVLPLAFQGPGQLTSISIQAVVGQGATPAVCVKGVIFLLLLLKELLLK